MKEKIEVSVYQHPTFEEGDILFQEDVLSELLAQCESLYLKTNPKNNYPKEEVEQRFAQLLQAVSLEKSLRIKLLDSVLPWEGLLDKLKRYYPQMVWTLGKKIDESTSEYSFEFIPLVENAEGFPFGTVLSQSLIQQGIPDDGDPVEGWEQEIFYILEDFLRTEADAASLSTEMLNTDLSSDSSVTTDEEYGYFDNQTILADVDFLETADEPDESDESIADTSAYTTTRSTIPESITPEAIEEPEVVEVSQTATPFYFNETGASDEEFKSTQVEAAVSDMDLQLQIENEELKRQQQELMAANEKLKDEISSLNEQAIMLQTTEAENIAGGNTMVLNKQALYYEEALRRERDAKERMRVTNDRLEHLVSRLERQVAENSLDIIDGEVPYVERSEDWYQKKHIDLLEYDQLYQKAKYLEHTWEVNQRLIVISERMTIGESEMKYERERVNRLKHSTKDIELFVMMDECRMINERVKVRPAFLWRKPRVTILTGDYENLVEKAAYFDVIQSENQMLEKIIDEHIEEVERE